MTYKYIADPHPEPLTTEEKEELERLRKKNVLYLTSDDFLRLEVLNFADVRERYRITETDEEDA